MHLMENCALIDQHGWAQLSIWEDCSTKLQYGHSYTLNPIQVKQFQRKYLTIMKKKTDIQPAVIPIPKKVAREMEEKARLELAYAVITVASFCSADNFSLHFICMNCKDRLSEVSTLDAIKCVSCGAIQMLENCKRVASIRLWASEGDDKLKLRLKDNIFEDFIKALNATMPNIKPVVLGETSEIDICTLILTQAKHVRVKYDKVLLDITSLQLLKPDPEAATETAAHLENVV